MQGSSQLPNQQKQVHSAFIRAEVGGHRGIPTPAASPVQQSDDQLAAEGWRMSIRLDGVLSRWVRERSQGTSRTPSDLVRAAIRLAMSQAERMEAVLVQARAREGMVGQSSHPASSVGPAVKTAAEAHNPSDVPRFPRELCDIVNQLRTFGPTAWSERRRRFVQVTALVQVCVEMSQERRDGELLADLLRLGTKHGLLPV